MTLVIISLLSFAAACGTESRTIPEPGSDEALAKNVPEMINVPILEEELNQGWYYGDISEKKAGTPDDWQWTYNEEDGTQSKWIKPVTEMMDY